MLDLVVLADVEDRHILRGGEDKGGGRTGKGKGKGNRSGRGQPMTPCAARLRHQTDRRVLLHELGDTLKVDRALVSPVMLELRDGRRRDLVEVPRRRYDDGGSGGSGSRREGERGRRPEEGGRGSGGCWASEGEERAAEHGMVDG